MSRQRDAELDRLRAAREAARQRQQAAWEAQQAAWERRSSARAVMNRAYEAKQAAYADQQAAWEAYMSIKLTNGPRIDSLSLKFASHASGSRVPSQLFRRLRVSLLVRSRHFILPGQSTN